VSTASLRSEAFSELDSDASPGRKAVRWVLILLAIGVLAFLVAWLLGYVRLTTDPRVVEIKNLQAAAQQQLSANGGPQTLDEAKAIVASMSQIREKIDELPENLRREAQRGGGNMFRSTMRVRINSYFSAPPEQRQAELDRQIKQEDLFRKAMEASRPAGGQQSGQQSGAPGGTAAIGGPGGAGQRGPGGGGPAAGGPGGAGRGGPGGPGVGGPPRNGSEEDRNRWRKNLIDNTSPDQRARYVEYRRAMDARREQLGKPSPWPR
jgi:hypothetical protein